MICAKCHQASPDDARFCGHCGATLAANEPQAESAFPGAAHSASAAAEAAFASAKNALPGIIQRVKNILLTPKTEWPLIESEPTAIPQLFKGYAMPLAAIAAVVAFIRLCVIGVTLPFGIGAYRPPLVDGLTMAVVRFALALLGLFLVGIIIDVLAPNFAGQRNQRQAMKTAVYAFTPSFVGSVFGLMGSLGGLLQLLASLYGIYLLYLGLPVMMKSAREKDMVYTAAVVACTLVLAVLIGVVINATGNLGDMACLIDAFTNGEASHNPAGNSPGAGPLSDG